MFDPRKFHLLKFDTNTLIQVIIIVCYNVQFYAGYGIGFLQFFVGARNASFVNIYLKRSTSKMYIIASQWLGFVFVIFKDVSIDVYAYYFFYVADMSQIDQKFKICTAKIYDLLG